MRELDKKGSQLCSYQASVFENSSKRFSCSSKIFLRRFFLSNFAFRLDFHEKNRFSFDNEDCYKDLLEEYGDSTYGKERISANVLHFIGYITRYICYTRDVTSTFVYHAFGVDLLIDNYEVLHTQNEEYVIRELLALNDLPSNYLDKDVRLKEIIRNNYRK